MNRQKLVVLRKCIGRDTEVQDILSHFKSNMSSAILIYGDPAIGKSTLMENVKDKLSGGKEFLVGFHEASGVEDPILYCMANLLTRMHSNMSMGNQLNLVWKNLKAKLGLEAFNRFMSDILKVLRMPGGGLDQVIRKFGVQVDEQRIPAINKDIFWSVFEVLKEVFPNKPVVLLVDNLSVGYEGDPSELAKDSYVTLRNVIELHKISGGLHLLISWKLDNRTKPFFDEK